MAADRLRLVAAIAAVLGALAVPLVRAATAGAVSFGVEAVSSSFTNADGSPDTRAGSHPYALTTSIVFNHLEQEGNVLTGGDPKDIEVGMPAGLIVNPLATPAECTEAQIENEHGPNTPHCPLSSAVGLASVLPGAAPGQAPLVAPVYNMVPPPGVPAELGFNVAGLGLVVHVLGRVRTGGDYGLSASVLNLLERQPIVSATLTLWGQPAAPAHDRERGPCARRTAAQKKEEEAEFAQEVAEFGKAERTYLFTCPVEGVDRAFLTLPGSCEGPLQTTVTATSWQEPTKAFGPYAALVPPLEECHRLAFAPSATVKPSLAQNPRADSPMGLDVDIKSPQEEGASGLAEADVRTVKVTLPEGAAISPSAADGLSGCSLQQIGLTSDSPSSCPDSSKIGLVKVFTPILSKPLEGGVYVAQQGNLPGNGENPFGSLVAVYLVAEGQGAVVKLAGRVGLDPSTGQVSVEFGEAPLRSAMLGAPQFLPQLPFSDLQMRFFGGPRAALVSPPGCGAYEASTQLTGWNGASVETASSFTIDSGCSDGFAPSLTAGTVSDQAGGSSPLILALRRNDGEQRLSGLSATLPSGVLASVSAVRRCGEPQARLGTCGPDSEIGHLDLALGAGEDPLWLRGAPVYLTGPYAGSPFGLSIVVPAVAGPFNLGVEGRPIVIRARLDVDRHTGQVTATSEAWPSILQGVPLDIRAVNMVLDRAGFVVDPTNCRPTQVAGTAYSTSGLRASVMTPFQVSDCARLPFHPRLTALTHATAGPGHGAYLHVRLRSGRGQANLAKLKLALPRELPGRLDVLHGACAADVFAANPATCPAAARVGEAVAVTPLLGNPLRGPVYLVSHGGAAFPDVVLVLQGEGLTVQVEGTTRVSRGVTSVAFRSLPDAPISSLDVMLPAGPRSVLAMLPSPRARKSVCAGRLSIAAALTGQNGAVLHSSTPVMVSGCPVHRHR
jgi:hypothetical protein